MGGRRFRFIIKKMRNILIIAVLLLGVEVAANGQEWFITATRKGGPSDGYITGAFMKKGWGFYGGLPYTEVTNDGSVTLPPGFNTSTGTISKNMKFGVLRQLKEDKAIVGFGIQPTVGGNKPNVFLMYNPLRPSSVLNLWTIGNLVGSDFTLGLGLSYKVK
jgi:hypothetical protein